MDVLTWMCRSCPAVKTAEWELFLVRPEILLAECRPCRGQNHSFYAMARIEDGWIPLQLVGDAARLKLSLAICGADAVAAYCRSGYEMPPEPPKPEHILAEEIVGIDGDLRGWPARLALCRRPDAPAGALPELWATPFHMLTGWQRLDEKLDVEHPGAKLITLMRLQTSEALRWLWRGDRHTAALLLSQRIKDSPLIQKLRYAVWQALEPRAEWLFWSPCGDFRRYGWLTAEGRPVMRTVNHRLRLQSAKSLELSMELATFIQGCMDNKRWLSLKGDQRSPEPYYNAIKTLCLVAEL